GLRHPALDGGCRTQVSGKNRGQVSMFRCQASGNWSLVIGHWFLAACLSVGQQQEASSQQQEATPLTPDA
ncbi:MAG: hypothetical protein V3V39_06515, partial [Desulfobacterales bacterium]